MPFKTLILPLTASLAIHTLVVASFGVSAVSREEPGNRFFDISYVRYTPENNTKIVSPPPQIQYPPMAKKADRAKEKMNQPVKEEAHFLNTKEDDSIKTHAPAASATVSSLDVKNSEEFLSDPQKGKVFLNYFGLVKQRVRRAIETGYSKQDLGRGDVLLSFVLKSDGAVVKVFSIDKDSSANEFMKDFAVRCVRECSPFPRFPKELGMDRISFNLSILFDET